MVHIQECAVGQTECVHFLQIDGQHDILLFIFHACQRERQPAIAVEAWHEVEPLALELVLFPHEGAVRLYGFKDILTVGKGHHGVADIHIHVLCLVTQILPVFRTNDNELNFHILHV